VLNLWAVPKLITTTDIRAAQSGDVPTPPSAAEPELQPSAAARLLPEGPAPAELELPTAEPEAEAEPETERGAPEAEAEPAANDAEPEAEAPAQAAVVAEQAPAPPAAAQLPSEAYAPPDPSSSTPFAIRAAVRAVRVALQDRAAVGGTGPFDGLSAEDQPLTQIYFSMGNFMLGPNGKQVLERMLPQLGADERPILIVGSADPSGSEQVNEKLSDARAQSVAEWMLAHGIDAGRIQTRAIGHEGAVGSTLDRRVDIWLGGSR
jgi:outer membrane protein OmpA-like peptidoglycan-associated protein